MATNGTPTPDDRTSVAAVRGKGSERLDDGRHHDGRSEPIDALAHPAAASPFITAPDQLYAILDRELLTQQQLLADAERRDQKHTQAAWLKARAMLNGSKYKPYATTPKFLDAQTSDS